MLIAGILASVRFYHWFVFCEMYVYAEPTNKGFKLYLFQFHHVKKHTVLFIITTIWDIFWAGKQNLLLKIAL